jgi:uncharacterized membrane protein YccC
MTFDIERLIHSFKTAIACIVALLLTKFIGLGADQWIVITVIVVMCAQIYVGSVIQKAYLRFLGTLAGCLLAASMLAAFGHTALIILLCTGVSSFIFSYLATSQENLSYMGTLGAVTTAIIMLGNNPTTLFAVQRFAEISAGILIATLISQYILPIRARTHLKRAQANTIEQLQQFYNATMIEHSITTSADYQDLDENIVKTILKQRQLAKESIRESLSNKFDTNHFMQTLYCEREILRIIWFMHDAFTHIKNAESTLANLPALAQFNTSIQQALTTFIHVIQKGNASKEHIHIPDLVALRTAIEQSTTTTNERLQQIYIDGFLFSAEVLTNTLARLAGLYQIMTYKA